MNWELALGRVDLAEGRQHPTHWLLKTGWRRAFDVVSTCGGESSDSVGGEGLPRIMIDLQVLEHRGQTLPEELEDMNGSAPAFWL